MPGDSNPEQPRASTTGGAAPTWLIHALIGFSGLGIGGATGSVATSGQVQAAVAATEQRLVGKIDLLSNKVDRGIADNARLEDRVEKALDRISALEMENARRGGAPR